MTAHDKQRRFRDLAKRLGLPVDADEPLMLVCPECQETTFQYRPSDLEFVCGDCTHRKDGVDHLEALARAPRQSSAAPRHTLQASSADTGQGAEIVALMPRQRATPVAAPIQASTQAQAESPPAHPSGPRSRPLGESVIIATLSLVFLGVGLLAAVMSGFANYQAFGAMVEDPLQSRIWAWTGIIASVCSFGGFTFVYWHWSHGRRKEGLRAILFAMAGAATSLVGTQMYMTTTENDRLAASEAARARSALIATQVTDWRHQLEAIPPDVRSVEGLEAYIEEVEGVGRTHQKPYRDARNELGLARRRAELETRIEVGRAELLTLGDAVAVRPARASWLSWFFAAMLEVFSSQGTSIGFVALMILAGRRRD